MELGWIEATDGQGAADALVANHARLVEAEAAEFGLAAHWADLHDPRTLGDGSGDGSGRVLPGTERARRSGGAGTAWVGEFAAAELGCLLGRSPVAAATLLADAVDVRHRLPLLAAAVEDGSARVWQARHVASRTRAVGLSREQARWVDARTTPYLGSLPWSRFQDLLEAKIVEVDPEAAEARRVSAALERFVVTGQCDEYGLKTVVARAEAGDAVFFVAMCDRVARADDSDDDPETGCPGCGRSPVLSGDPTAFVKALATIDPRRLLPEATLYVHVSRESFDATRCSDKAGGSGGVARVEGVGPVTIEQVREFLRHTHVTLRPVLDLAADHPVDGYEVPDRLREQLHLRTPAEVFPWSGNLSRRKDLDHTVPYLPPDRGGPPGQTRMSNLGPMTRYAHRVKTHGRGWRHHQPVPGVFLWRTPHGYWYRTDHTGTHPLGKHPTDADLAGRTRLPRDPRIVTDPGTRAPTTPASPAEAHLAALLAVP